MKRNSSADRVWVMGIQWKWDYKARKWAGDSLVGVWRLWRADRNWMLASPTGAMYTLDKKDRNAAMVQAGFKIAEVEAYLAGR
jgi:hypothetical protein